MAELASLPVDALRLLDLLSILVLFPVFLREAGVFISRFVVCSHLSSKAEHEA